MTLFAWGLEGQLSGDPVTVANSDDFGDPAWSAVSASGFITYSTAQAFVGSRSILVNVTTAATAVNLDKTDTASAGGAVHVYVMLLSYPSVDIQGPYGGRGGGGALWHVRITPTGQVRNVIGATVGTASVGTMALNTWYRLESVPSGFGTAASQVVTNVYVGHSTTVAFAVPTVSGVTTASQIDTIRWTKFGGTSTIAMHLDDPRQNIGAVAELGPTLYVGGEHLRYFKNYDYARLGLEADQRGFIVGQSRIGVSKLRSTLGTWTSLKAGFISINVSLSCRVVDGAWLEPEVSSLMMVSRQASAFATYDGTEVRLTYDGGTVFTGVVSESTLASEIGENNTEEFTVSLTARGYESIKNGLPAVGTAVTLYGSSGGSTAVVQWVAGKVRKRAADITGRTITAEDGRADAQLEEVVDTENDTTGLQGELLGDLAIRSGLLLDQSSGNGVSFRSYQGVPLWSLEDKHLVSGYSLAVDRDTATAIGITRKEDETFVQAYRAGTARVVTERTISMQFNDSFNMGVFGAYVPLQGDPKKYLVSATVPRHNDLQIPSRLPIQARFRHGPTYDTDLHSNGDGQTYRGAVTSLTHSITPERWMMQIECQPVHLVTRVGDLAPAPPQHVKVALVGTTATLTWSTRVAGVVQAATINSFQLLTADADNIDVGDDLTLYTNATLSTQAEDAIFRVTAKGSPSGGQVTVSISPKIGIYPVSLAVPGMVLAFTDYGPAPDGGWEVWYQRALSQDNRKIHPASIGAGANGVNTYTNTATITGLLSGESYRFTVYAVSTTPNVRSAPSKYVEVVVP